MLRLNPFNKFVRHSRLGCIFRHSEHEHNKCTNRTNANYTASVHVVFSSFCWLFLSSSEGGAGFDVHVAMRLEFSWAEVVAGSLIAIASTAALFQFATRESVNEESEQIGVLLGNLFLLCWFLAVVTLAFTIKKIRTARARNRVPARSSVLRAMPGRRTPDGSQGPSRPAVVVLPFAWSCVMISLSFVGYTVPQFIRCCWSNWDFLKPVVHFSLSNALDARELVGTKDCDRAPSGTCDWRDV